MNDPKGGAVALLAIAAALAKRLRDKTVATLAIKWKEDVRRWHPGQAWIWRPGGFGVFDPGINALSILTTVLPKGLSLHDTELDIPENVAMPIAARLRFGIGAGPADLTADFDWRQTGPQTWDIEIRTTDGTFYQLHNGGRTLLVDGKAELDEPSREYKMIYKRFASLIDAFMVGRRNTVEAFHERREGE
jgi:D-galactose 1-dehydrogenase